VGHGGGGGFPLGSNGRQASGRPFLSGGWNSSGIGVIVGAGVGHDAAPQCSGRVKRPPPGVGVTTAQVVIGMAGQVGVGVGVEGVAVGAGVGVGVQVGSTNGPTEFKLAPRTVVEGAFV